MGERARPPDDISPVEFFTRWVPERVARDHERRERLGDTRASLVFDLGGDGSDGDGCFTLEIEAGRVRGARGRAADPDLEVHVDVDTWRELNRGDLSAPEALLRRRVKLHGDYLLALKLHLILG